MKATYSLTALSLFCFATVQAQNGYIRLENDSVLVGYIKPVLSVKDGDHALEFWKTKNDKSPRRIIRKDILDYAIKNDTFRVLKNFKPFDSEELFIDNQDARILQSGRVELLKVRNPYYKNNNAGMLGVGVVPGITVGVRIFKEPIWNIPNILILHVPRNHLMRGVPEVDEQFSEVVHDLFSEIAIQSFEKENGPLRFGDLRKFVAFYNLKTSVRKN
jgi:hypothetical protein